jgi:hypothetical protein
MEQIDNIEMLKPIVVVPGKRLDRERTVRE